MLSVFFSPPSSVEDPLHFCGSQFLSFTTFSSSAFRLYKAVLLTSARSLATSLQSNHTNCQSLKMKPTFALPILLGLAASQATTCGGPEPTASLTMQFTARIPAQVAPTSTVYGAFVTSFLNASSGVFFVKSRVLICLGR